MSGGLKACPFCGEPAKILTARCAEDGEMATVECTGCLASTTAFEDAYAPREQAAEAWNTRTTSVEGPLVEIVREYIAELENPSPDWAMRKHWRDKMRAALASYRKTATPAKGG